MTTVLVTGANGKLGRAVVAALLAAGHGVRATDRDEPPLPLDDVDWVHRDLAVAGAAGDLVDGCDAVVHLAAIPAPVLADASEVFRTNVETAFEVTQACLEQGIERLVIASSVSALGTAWAREPFSPLTVPIDEDHPLVPRDPYGLSKLVTEEIGRSAVRQGLPAVLALRYHSVLTATELADAVRQVADDPGAGAATLWGYIELEDAARATMAAVFADLEGFHALHVVAQDTTSQIATALLVERHHPTSRRSPDLSGTCSAWDGSRAAEALAFQPQYRWRPA